MEKPNGWVKIWRQIYVDLKGSKSSSVFVYLIASACWRDETVTWRGSKIPLKRGQVMTSRNEIADMLSITEANARWALNSLIIANRIAIRTTKRGMEVTILNYDEYQEKLEDQQPTEYPRAQPEYSQQKGCSYIEEEYKKENIPPRPIDPIDLALANAWAIYAQENGTTVRINPKKWADVIRLLRTEDGLTHDTIRAMLEFVRTDEFWRDKATSLPGIRNRSKNGERKHKNIRDAMERAERKPKAEAPLKIVATPLSGRFRSNGR
jgi:hypothetical protein